MAVWYCGSTRWTAVTQWAASTAYSVGALRRQLATPTVGNERVFRCTTAGTSGGTEPTWVITKGATTNDGTAVWTEVTGNSAYGWTAAAARVVNLNTWVAAGDWVYVSSVHNETGATGTVALAPTSTAAAPVLILSVDDSSTPPTALLAGATVNIGGNNFTFSGFAYYYGITFTSTSASLSALGWISNSEWWNCLDNCKFRISGNTARYSVGPSGVSASPYLLDLVNTTFRPGGTAVGFLIRARCSWTGGGLESGGTSPTTMFLSTGTASHQSDFRARGLDLTVLGANNLLDVSSSVSSNYELIGCNFATTVTPTTGGVAGPGGTQVRLTQCLSESSANRYYRQTFQGIISQSPLVYRVGGGQDGFVPVARKMVSTSVAEIVMPLMSDFSSVWNDVVGVQQSLAVRIVNDGVTLTNADIWIEVDYLGNYQSNFPVTVVGRAGLLATPVNLPTSSATWVTAGSLASPVAQDLVVTFTAKTKGPVRVRVCLAKASATVYYCPRPVIF